MFKKTILVIWMLQDRFQFMSRMCDESYIYFLNEDACME